MTSIITQIRHSPVTKDLTFQEVSAWMIDSLGLAAAARKVLDNAIDGETLLYFAKKCYEEFSAALSPCGFTSSEMSCIYSAIISAIIVNDYIVQNEAIEMARRLLPSLSPPARCRAKGVPKSKSSKLRCDRVKGASAMGFCPTAVVRVGYKKRKSARSVYRATNT